MAGGNWTSCGDVDYGNGIHDVKAKQVACSTAKKVAEHQFKTGDTSFDGWECRERQQSESFNPICVRHRGGDKQVVKFHYGV